MDFLLFTCSVAITFCPFMSVEGGVLLLNRNYPYVIVYSKSIMYASSSNCRGENSQRETLKLSGVTAHSVSPAIRGIPENFIITVRAALMSD